MRSYDEHRAEDVSAASAAYIWDVLPEIMSSESGEGFQRLAIYVHTAIKAYFGDEEYFVVPEPSRN
jgi:hypothetical protein